MLLSFFLFTSFLFLLAAIFFDSRYLVDALIFLALPLAVRMTKNRICSAALALICLWSLISNLLHPPQTNFFSIRLLWTLGLCWGALIFLQRTFRHSKTPSDLPSPGLETEDAGWEIILQKYFESLAQNRPSILALPESLLPYERSVIADAILVTLRRSRDLSPSGKLKLESGYAMLSRFVPDEEAAVIYEAESLAEEGNARILRDFWEASGGRLNEILKGIHEREESYAREFTRRLEESHDHQTVNA